ncbi:chemotaxis protein CheB [Sphingomonas sp. RB1R13]|uniref:chemotaxis protein CheB n=1 Tax=Sphingomonas sp. RB1R13 TaxID=3096159 RepID=UPI002FC7B2DA
MNKVMEPAGTVLPHTDNFSIICVGGSAGSLDAYKQFFENLPMNLGIAIVIVNHVTRSFDKLHKILPRHTNMPVDLITDQLLIQPDHVYIIPAKRELHVFAGKFCLRPISKARGWPDVITIFLRSLAQQWDGKLIAVIVSGLDGDGAAAMGDIKRVGGITIVQTPETAEWSDMPEDAIKTGSVDFVLSARDIARKISEIVVQKTL